MVLLCAGVEGRGRVSVYVPPVSGGRASGEPRDGARGGDRKEQRC